MLFLTFFLSKSATSSALDWSELTLFVFGIVLVIGLIGDHKTPDPHSRRMKLFEIFVIVGVAGELLADGGVFLFSHQLQVISDSEIAAANRKAADAGTSATTAHEEAEAAKDAAGKAQQRAGAVAKQTDGLNRNFQATKTQLMAVDVKRAESEKSLIDLAVCNAPRVMPSWL